MLHCSTLGTSLSVLRSGYIAIWIERPHAVMLTEKDRERREVKKGRLGEAAT